VTGESFLFKDDSGDVFTLNSTGGLVYRLYSEGLSPKEIARRLAARYRVLEGRALDDVRAFLAQVRVHGFSLNP
jgi:hypothetical protein